MTVSKLHKILTKAIAEGKGRLRVSVNKSSFTHALEEDGCVFIDLHKCQIETIPRISDDGGTAVDSKGVEHTLTLFVLDGGNDPRLTQELLKP